MNTTATMIPSATIGKKSFSTGPPLIHALIPAGAEVRIEAKIRSEMPLPTPRFVIISPIHISSVVPAVSVITIRTIRPVFELQRALALEQVRVAGALRGREERRSGSACTG